MQTILCLRTCSASAVAYSSIMWVGGLTVVLLLACLAMQRCSTHQNLPPTVSHSRGDPNAPTVPKKMKPMSTNVHDVLSGHGSKTLWALLKTGVVCRHCCVSLQLGVCGAIGFT